MNAKDIEKLIRVDEREIGNNIVEVRASITLSATQFYDDNLARSMKNDLVPHIHEKVREMLMRSIYEDQRREFYDALSRLLLCNPMDYKELDTARENLLNVAKRLQPC